MINKKLFVLTILVMLIASLGIISATDIQNDDTTTIADHSSSNDNTIQTDDTKAYNTKTDKQIQKNVKTIETNKKESQTESVTNYEQLYDNLTYSTTEDLTISLDGENQYFITDTITVNESIQNLKIEGNGKIIDGQHNYQFLIINHECNLILNNITIQNCIANEEGGAIYQTGGKLSINNSKFLSNMARYGGAISYYNYGDDSTINIFHSTFDSNGKYLTDYSEEGGALDVHNKGNITIEDTTITNNKASYGSALYLNNHYRPASGESKAINDEDSNMKSTVSIKNSRINSNGILDTDYGYTREGAIVIDTPGNITLLDSEFKDNIALYGGALSAVSYNDLLVKNSTFDNNGLRTKYNGKERLGMRGGALYLNPDGNTTITNSSFTNNHELTASAIYMEGHYWYDGLQNSLNISNSTFDSNMGTRGTVYLNYVNASITNTNFTNNKEFTKLDIPLDIWDYSWYYYYETYYMNGVYINEVLEILSNENGYVPGYEYQGLTIFAYQTELLLNNTNFLENGFSRNITENDFLKTFGGEGLIYSYSEYDTIIDNSNFISNYVLGEGGIIKYIATASYTQQEIAPLNQKYAISNPGEQVHGDYSYYAPGGNGNITINNSKFEDNDVINGGYHDEVEGNTLDPIEGYVLHLQGNVRIDNSDFINNKIVYLFETPENEIAEYSTGVIYFNNGTEYRYSRTCNVTNSNFMFNNPANFIIQNNRIILNYTIDSEDVISMDDNYIPDYGNVWIYVDGSDEGIKCKLLTRDGKTYVEDFTISDEYLIKMVVNQTSDSQYYSSQKFYNNAYYFRVPHEITLSVNATDPTYCGENATIRGKLYYTKNNGEDYVFADEDIDLYINGTYIATTKTDANGEYEFNYTTTNIGQQNVLVMLNNSKTLGKANNTTKFNVIRSESVINIDAKNITIGEKSKITITLSKTNNKKIEDADVTIVIENNQITRKTDKNGTITYECEITTPGIHQVSAYYNGDNTIAGSSNSTTFEIYKLNSSIQLTAPNTKIYEETTISGKLIDSNGKTIPYAPITIYINEHTINKETDKNGQYTYKYTPDNPNENYVKVFYAGNDTYKNSANTTTFQVDKLNTNTKATPITKNIGNLTFQVNVTDENGKTVNTGRVIIYDEKGRSLTTQIVDSSTTTLTITDIKSGTYKFNIEYEENNIYYSSNTTSTVTIIPKANIDIEILNNTEGNVQIEFYVTNEKDEVLKQQEVTIKLPNGTTIKEKTDNNGIITVTDPTATAGTKNVTATITTTSKLIGTTKTKNVNIVKIYPEITNANDEINNINNIINHINNIINEITEKIKEKNTTTPNQTIIKAIAQNGTIGNTKIAVTIENELTQPLANEGVTILNDKGEIIGTGVTDKKGIAVIPIKTLNGNQNVTVVYPGNGNNGAKNSTISVTSYKNNVTVVVDAVTGTVGEEITLTAHLTDNNKKPVNGGNLVFKVNGKTLRTDGRFDSNAPAWKFKVENGLVTITIEADIYLRNAKTLTASYSGTYQYNEAKSNTVVAQIKKRNAQITLSTTPRIQKPYQTITFVAKVKDVTPNAKNSKMVYTNTKVIFKINGKTLKDAQGNTIQVAVNKDGTATYKYIVPPGMSSIKKNGELRDYNISCILVSDAFYPDTRDETFFCVDRTPITIGINKVTVNKNNKLSINADIKDISGNKVIGTNDVSIKINGKTYMNSTTNKTAIFKVNNGTINIKNLPISKNINIKTVTIVTGARQAYFGQKNETSNIVKV